MGHDDMQRKTTRFHPHAHDPLARVWAGDYANLALNPAYEKTAAPFSKRRNGVYQGVDRSAGGFFGFNPDGLRPEETPGPYSLTNPAGGSMQKNTGLLLALGVAAVLFLKR